MGTIVVKFGGSSVADNEKLNLVSNIIIKLYENGNRVVVVLSAQGKTTDTLINQATQLTDSINLRELDALISSRRANFNIKISNFIKFKGLWGNKFNSDGKPE